MKIQRESSKMIKPLYEGNPPSTTDYIRLSVFDKVAYDETMGIIHAYYPPNPTNVDIETGLRKALSVYREWAGRLSKDGDGEPIILLNDAGVRFVEASADVELRQILPLKPSAAICSNFHPSEHGEVVEELVQVQITRFACGSIVVGFAGHHVVADGQAASQFSVAWGQACRGLEIRSVPLHDRGIFNPRDPPRVEYEHRGVEFKIPNPKDSGKINRSPAKQDVVEGLATDKVHFSLDFLAKLKQKAAKAAANSPSDGDDGKIKAPFSTFESLVGHIWRAVTKARGLSSYQTTEVKLSVNGRWRMNPRIADEYFGNVVLWAYPSTKVKDLLTETPPSYGAKLIRDAVAELDDNYFRSFIDFASHKEENLVPTSNVEHRVSFPNMEVISWLRFPFHELDFGGGCPFLVMPSYNPAEGSIFLLPSFIGDGSIDVHLSLFQDHMAAFYQICYDLD